MNLSIGISGDQKNEGQVTFSIFWTWYCHAGAGLADVVAGEGPHAGAVDGEDVAVADGDLLALRVDAIDVPPADAASNEDSAVSPGVTPSRSRRARL